jgi:tetratricopeptide (TPR) repeat protein
MLTEEALILVSAFAGLALLVLGVMEELWPTRPRHPGRPSRDPWRRARPANTPRAAAPAPAGRKRVLEPVAPAPPSPHRAGSAPPLRGAAPALDVSASSATEATQPPIEQLLRAQAEIIEELTHSARSTSPRDARRRPPEPPIPPPEPPGPAGARAPVSDTPAPPVVAAGSMDVTPADGAAASAPNAPETELEPESVETASTRAADAAIEQLTALWEAKCFSELATDGMAVLEAGGLNAEASAKVWGLIALAKRELGDADGARAALEEAIIVAPPAEAPTWTRHLAALSLSTAQSLLARTESAARDSEERITTIRSAMNWLEGGLAAVPGDAELVQTLARAREALWPTYDEVINALVQRQEFYGARRLLREALADEDCPAALQSSFRDLLSATFGGEVGQLTAEAIRRMQDGKEDEAIDTLERAEGVLATIPGDAIPVKRRQELERRLWWSYTKLGIRRVEGGMWEEALGPLMHALSFESVGPERQEETRRPLVRALEGMVEARAPLIRRLIEDGDRGGALATCDKLWACLKAAMDRGISPDELAGALARAQQLFDKLGRKHHA